MDGENHIRVGKLNLVDLAGSERQAKTGAAVSMPNSIATVLLSLTYTYEYLLSFSVLV